MLVLHCWLRLALVVQAALVRKVLPSSRSEDHEDDGASKVQGSRRLKRAALASTTFKALRPRGEAARQAVPLARRRGLLVRACVAWGNAPPSPSTCPQRPDL